MRKIRSGSADGQQIRSAQLDSRLAIGYRTGMLSEPSPNDLDEVAGSPAAPNCLRRAVSSVSAIGATGNHRRRSIGTRAIRHPGQVLSNLKLMPHHHAEDRVYTVISGVSAAACEACPMTSGCRHIHREPSLCFPVVPACPLAKSGGPPDPGSGVGPFSLEHRPDRRSPETVSKVWSFDGHFDPRRESGIAIAVKRASRCRRRFGRQPADPPNFAQRR